MKLPQAKELGNERNQSQRGKRDRDLSNWERTCFHACGFRLREGQNARVNRARTENIGYRTRVFEGSGSTHCYLSFAFASEETATRMIEF